MSSAGPEDQDPAAAELEARLSAFLADFLGAWPPVGELLIATSPARHTPGWDGQVRPLAGVATPEGMVVSVPPEHLEQASSLAAAGRAAFGAGVGELFGRPSARLRSGIFRAARRLVDLGEPGEWLASEYPRLPGWLAAFPGEVLVSFDDEGRYAAGVGLKRHSALGREIAVGTEPAHRGRGLARGLVAQAARRIFAEGATATYLHAPDNFASGAVATAAGFPDLGWRSIGLTGGEG